MEVLTTQLPSGGYGYDFNTITIRPLNFLELTGYMENVPSDPLEKYLFDIKVLAKDDNKIYDCYIMDLDFLIFYKKLCTVSGDLTYNLEIKCPNCGNMIKKKIDIATDIQFKQLDTKLMNGVYITLGGHKYEAGLPTVKEFITVLDTYLRVRKITDLQMIKTIALVKDFDIQGNQIENDILNAEHEDITLLMALRDLYYDAVYPINVTCRECFEKGERSEVAVSIDDLIVDFFRELYRNSPIDGSKIVFK